MENERKNDAEMRDRLIKILSIPIYPREGVDPAEVVADYLLDNGVIVPHCKVGDTVYQTDGARIYESCITHIEIYSFVTVFYTDGVAFDETAIGKSIYLTKEEAEAALERSGK